MTDYSKPYRFRVEVAGLEIADFQTFAEISATEVGEVSDVTLHTGGTTTVTFEDEKNADLIEWYREVMDGVGAPQTEEAEPYSRDLILRPTDRPTGIYEDPDDPSNMLVIGELGSTGQHVEMIWVNAGTADHFAQPGDLIAEGAYLKATETLREADSGITTEQLTVGTEPVCPE